MNQNLERYTSIEEFIHQNGREPNIDEYHPLYQVLWNRYLRGLTEEERKAAMVVGNLKLQAEIIQRIPRAAERLREHLRDNKDIIRIGFYERWGAYQLSVRIPCQKLTELYRFRQSIPNFFEGWYVELVPTSVFQRLPFQFRKLLHRH